MHVMLKNRFPWSSSWNLIDDRMDIMFFLGASDAKAFGSVDSAATHKANAGSKAWLNFALFALCAAKIITDSQP